MFAAVDVPTVATVKAPALSIVTSPPGAASAALLVASPTQIFADVKDDPGTDAERVPLERLNPAPIESSSGSPEPAVERPMIFPVLMFCIFANVTASFAIVAATDPAPDA